MGIEAQRLANVWVQQGPNPNCGSCCMASIVNYARLLRNAEATMPAMNNNAFIGLTVGGVHSLGSISARLCQWLTTTYPNRFQVTEVKVAGQAAHWGGLSNKLSGGTSHRPTITPDLAYFGQYGHRLLLREFSVAVVAGHFIIQTGPDQFWDPNRHGAYLPQTLAQVAPNYSLLSQRADALQIDVL